MKENKYDDPDFFKEYSRMGRSVNGLAGAGEWHVLQQMLPSFENKTVLDLGCGFGWHCRYAVEQGATKVLGIDLSQNMINQANRRNNKPGIEYQCLAVEDYDYPAATFDVVISSLTLHYLVSFDDICRKVYHTLKSGGTFVFSVEHPVFTAYGTQDWHYNTEGKAAHWPVDRYFTEGKRNSSFLGEKVVKYHKTLTTYIGALLKNGFEIIGLEEPQPEQSLLETVEGMRDELRRPMMLIISAKKD